MTPNGRWRLRYGKSIGSPVPSCESASLLSKRNGIPPDDSEKSFERKYPTVKSRMQCGFFSLLASYVKSRGGTILAMFSVFGEQAK